MDTVARLLHPPPSGLNRALSAAGGVGGGKQVQRLLSSLHAAATSADPSNIRKLVASSSKPAALHALSRLLSLSSPLALPVYEQVREANWFKWNPKLTASVVSLLHKQGWTGEAEALISESVSKLCSPRELAFFYCDLIDAFSERGLKDRVLELYALVREMGLCGRRPFESIIKALCLMGMPEDAETMLNEMRISGFEPSAFEFRLVAQCYGRLGSYMEMRRILRFMDEAGHPVDLICANIVLSCYGDQVELSKMLSWLQRMREMNIEFSVRTFNTVLNSCPLITSMMQNLRSLPLSVDGLFNTVERDSPSAIEALLVRELLSSTLLDQMLEWSSSISKLDLHGFHLASAYVILLQWMEELRIRFKRDEVVPSEVSVVCGSGKHSGKVGKSQVKMLVSEMMFQMKSPMKMDRKNVGRFVARGKAVRDWLC